MAGSVIERPVRSPRPPLGGGRQRARRTPLPARWFAVAALVGAAVGLVAVGALDLGTSAAEGVGTQDAAPPATPAPAETAADDPVTEDAAAPQDAVAPAPLPGDPGQPPIRAVHMTGGAWSDPALRDPVVAALDDGRLNTVQLDLKDESGKVGYDTRVPFALEIGGVGDRLALARVVEELHARGVRVVGRLVAFADPSIVAYARATGRTDLVIQTPSGGIFAGYGGFANLGSPVVQEYVVALAEEAAALGVDDILFDYVRRPEGPRSGMVFEGLEGDPADVVVGVLAAARERVAPYGARVGASVFGVSATCPRCVAQPIDRIAKVADYVAPMVYPSHWKPGQLGVADPHRQPGPMVAASVPLFVEAVAGTEAVVTPWLQDFTLDGVPYGAQQVRAQVEAAAAAGGQGFLLWDPACTYHLEGLDPQPPPEAPASS